MQAELIKTEKEGNALKISALIYESPEVLERLVGLSGQEVHITITKKREKRSLDSNDYFWALVRGLALAIHGTTNHTALESVYLQLLKDYGQSIVITVSSKCDISKLGWKYYDRFKDGLISGKPFTAYKVYIGSSQYTQPEMQKLIEGTQSECKKYGVKNELDDYYDLMA